MAPSTVLSTKGKTGSPEYFRRSEMTAGTQKHKRQGFTRNWLSYSPTHIPTLVTLTGWTLCSLAGQRSDLPVSALVEFTVG